MFKLIIASILISFLVGCSVAMPMRVHKPNPYGFCTTCVFYMPGLVEDVLAMIAQGEDTSSCQSTCDSFTSSEEIMVCLQVCKKVGITDFISLIKENPDPIYACQYGDECITNPDIPTASVTVGVKPTQAPKGTTFTASGDYTVNEPLMIGSVAWNVTNAAGKVIFSDSKLVTNVAVGITYPVTFQFLGSSTGTFEANVAICSGTCGSVHSVYIDSFTTSFLVTK
ncbi:hypothetical protein DFA_02615 [Cavenderia fasciculata]|uniref:Countin-like protein n=1 Tax=Cavenderia fasciculata TaxID=261658 RepID=F4PZW2_CACFS|nr:uncharacterized protein DFA_02615 [Cavenderia fasciculata]EGG18876.1 hypothetical protein DFA_02615 [Cavenderia fasciculata]|eukprot:XP_004357338.1 hypothetical protein DFA_02615 [Cavenderia fasciculata]